MKVKSLETREGRPERAAQAGRKSVSQRKGRNHRQREVEQKARKVAVDRHRLGLWTGFGLRAGFVLLVMACLTGGTLWVKSNLSGWEWFSVKSIEINGLSRLDRGEVLARTHLEVGASWLWIGASKAEHSIRAMPGVAAAKVTRAFPSRVVIDIVEDEPVALAHHGYWLALFADSKVADGRRWSGQDLPIIEVTQAMRPHLRAALCDFLGKVKREKPESFARFSQVTPLDGSDIAVILRDGQARLVLDVTAKSLNSLDFLERLLRDHAATWRAGANIDLRVTDHAYVL
jgi:POTRA domain, FtsQ-type